MKKQTFTIPVWALSYLANRDKSGLTLVELRLCQDFERSNRILPRLMDIVSEEEFFSATNSLCAPLAGNCVEAEFCCRYTSDELFNRIVCRVDTSRGAPMGRANSKDRLPVWWDALWKKTPHFDRIVTLDSGGYDRGGAYWGIGSPVRVRISKDGQFWQFYRL